jgi:hypothetical protein
MQDTVRLNWKFDASRLQHELNGILPSEYIPHFNTRYYQGDWSVVPLRSVGGSATQIYPDPTSQHFADTPLLERCSYAKSILSSLQCSLTAVRFLRLAAGSTIREHRDYNLSIDDGEIRLHVPVITNPDVEFILAGKRIEMREGECWYLNFNLLHSVANRGNTDRIHLVIDCVVNEWLRKVLNHDASDAPATPG